MEDWLVPGTASPRPRASLRAEAKFLNRGKMWALYSDYEMEDFFAPSEVISRALVKAALRLAHNRVRLVRQFESSFDFSGTTRRITKADIDRFEEMVKAAKAAATPKQPGSS